MPTTYTHDLFGKKVYRQLPEEIRKVIRENGNLFLDRPFMDRIFCFMTCSIKRSAVWERKCTRYLQLRFFLRGMSIVRRTGDERLLAYLLGFACHYLLDSSCHPFVDETA